MQNQSVPSQAASVANAVESEPSSTFDPRAFRQCLGQFGTGVGVMTTHDGQTPAGLTANSFSSLSLDPPLVLWSISRTSRSFETFRDADSFAINILAADQMPVSQIFASKQDDKFSGVAWDAGVTGSPVLHGVAAYIDCDKHACIEGGDHIIVVGRVRDFKKFDHPALLYVQGRYALAIDHPAAKPAAKSEEPSSTTADVERWQTMPLLSLLYRASNVTALRFESHRKAEGLSVLEGRILSGLYDFATQTLEQLSTRLYLGNRDARDAVAQLKEKGYLVAGSEDTLALTPAGRACREAIGRRMQSFDHELLGDLSSQDIDVTRRVLCALMAKENRPQM